MASRYKVIFMGPADRTPSTLQVLKKGLRERFRLSAEEVERLVAMAPVRVKKEVGWEEAFRFKRALEELGAKVKVEPMEGELIDIKTEEETPSGMMKCPQCGYVQPRSDECVNCGVIISKYLQYKEKMEKGEEGRPPPSAPSGGWEEEGEGLFQTIKDILFSPTFFFRSMSTQGGLQTPLLFGVIMGTIGGLFPLLWNFLFSAKMSGFVDRFSSTMMIGYALLLPLFVAIGIFIIGGVLHLCLMLVGGNRKGFEATFRVVAYTQATQLFGIIPIVGGFIASIYALVLHIIGLREAHEITTGRAALAVFIPVIAALIFVVILFAIFFSLFLGSLHSMKPPARVF